MADEGFSWGGFDQELQTQNAALLQALDDKELEIGRLTKALSSRPASSASAAAANGGGAAAGRVAELARRNRDMTAALEAERARHRKAQVLVQDLEQRAAKLERDNSRLQRKLAKLSTGPLALSASTASSSVAPSESVVADDRPESLRLAEKRSEIQVLKKELHMTQKALEHEVGGSVSAAALLSGRSGWKGRAEQISMLKRRLADAQQQQRQQDGEALASTVGSVRASASSVHGERNRSSIRAIEAKRKEEAAQLAEDHEQLTSKHGVLRKKHESAKARNTILSREAKELRAQLADMRAALDDSEKAIVQLQGDLDDCRRAMAETQQAATSPRKPVHVDANALEALQALTAKCRHQQDRIAELEGAAALAEEQQRLRPRPPPGRPPSSSRGSSAGRPATNRSSRSLDPHLLQSGAETAPLSQRDPGLQQQLSEKETLLRVADVEKQRLTELAALLSRQIGDAKTTIGRLETQLRVERKARALLEVDKQRDGTLTPGDDVEKRAALAEAESQGLRATVASLQQQKEEEVAVLHRLMTEMRRVFSEGLKRYKSHHAASR